MIKKLFLVDGLAGTGKNDLIEFIDQKHRLTSTVIYKYTTRMHRNPEEAQKTDLVFISEDDFKTKCSNLICFISERSIQFHLTLTLRK